MMIRLFACVLACAAAAASANATGSPLSITTRVLMEQRRAASDGTTRIVLASPDRVGPGDRVVVVMAYRNTGKLPLGDVILADPLPRSLAYLRVHAGSPEPELSTDGRSWGTLTELPQPVGVRPATQNDVAAVRWRLLHPLAPGEAGALAFDAIVK